ncbi:MAG TPA: SufE family protein [Verrucomicrobiales bacterium]|nr:SufE family protein [Verrucomicrobiales bacterium]
MAAAENAAVLAGCLAGIADPMERLQEVIRFGVSLEPYPEDERHGARLVEGCVSRVWLWLRVEEGRCQFLADADSPMVKGLAALVVRLYHGVSPEDAAASEVRLAECLGLERIVSPTRMRGMVRIQAAARSLARQFCATVGER